MLDDPVREPPRPPGRRAAAPTFRSPAVTSTATRVGSSGAADLRAGGEPDQPSRSRAEALLGADDLDGLLEHAIDSGDTYVRRRLAMRYERRGDRRALREPATFSRRGARHWAAMLARDEDVGELLRAVVCGDGFALRALPDWPLTALDDAQRETILRFGLTPDGHPAPRDDPRDPAQSGQQ